MQPTYNFFIVNRDRKTIVRYEGSIFPRIGDTFRIANWYLKVIDVVFETAQASGVAAAHSWYVHVEEVECPFDHEECEEVDLNEFCDRMKQ
jgi:hypothetical protein